MTREALYRIGFQLAAGVILVFPVTYFLNLFEMTTHIPVEGFSRGIVILVFCVWPPMLFTHFFEVRRRAPRNRKLHTQRFING